ncbi:hypothetical protein ACFSSC_09265 [Corynebacterium mendelii]|uniref:DUF4013 domain-containing protein n=1 Tax=Corynebacterium mendelii TaxID=2765362 RepID=A0A939E3T7_9CORY|nr:hypothetical protein [Corynebacterium mendelii]MBN9645166.1 hypothetical protein [Corynebacterium mendelii]
MNANHLPDYGPEEPAGDFYRGPQPPASSLPPGVVQSDGSLKVFATIGTGFSQLFARFLPWFLLGLLGFAGVMVIGVGAAVLMFFTVFDTIDPATLSPDADVQMPLGVMVAIAVLSVVFSAVLTTAAYNGALQVAENRRISFGDFFRFKHGFGIPFLVTAVVALPSTVSVVFQSTDPTGNDALLFGGLYLLVMLVLLVASPLYQLAPFYALDHGCGIGESFVRCFADGSRNYLPLLGLSVLVAVMVTISVFTIVGALILLPFSGIAYALAYRQISHGVHVTL